MKRKMLIMNNKRKSSLIDLPIPAEDRHTKWSRGLDASFTRLIQECQILRNTPEAFVLTAYSAIPIADSIRGFFDELGHETPPMTYIKANIPASTRYYTGQLRPEDEELLTETHRLRSFLAGAQHVGVIDQYVATGMTISYAGELLKFAGAETPIGLRGNWYTDVTPGQVSLNSLECVNPELKSQMHSLGAKACQLAYA